MINAYVEPNEELYKSYPNPDLNEAAAQFIKEMAQKHEVKPNDVADAMIGVVIDHYLHTIGFLETLNLFSQYIASLSKLGLYRERRIMELNIQ